MGRDPAEISREIERTRADLAITIAELRSTDVKAELAGRVDAVRRIAVTRGRAKVHELQPILRARVRDKARELQPVLKARAQAKVQEVRTTAIAAGREKVQELKPVALARVAELKPVALARVAELKPVAIARAKDKAAELTPALLESAKAKAREVRPLIAARASATVDELKSNARTAAGAKLEAAKGAAVVGVTDLGGRAVGLARSKRNIAGACATLAAGALLLVTRQRLRRRSRTRLQRVAAHAEAVNREATDRLHRARGRAVDRIHQGADAPRRLRRRLRRG
jgi:hypothetical protein